MKILVINSGSSSIKFELFNMPSRDVEASGALQRIGEEQSEAVRKARDAFRTAAGETPAAEPDDAELALPVEEAPHPLERPPAAEPADAAPAPDPARDA